ncbi:hypothetical protein PG994_005506 [Apiospora phragmitis]|uniref:Zn(2)-C6 fungal-type domain-containing protein n=1 Tax=Apiospora phragmitis TaxID=2905665 RepID=A0ABR1VCF3_9PEZI
MESPKRKRARLACQPCRERKRKCDGQDPPCSTCSQWGYECSYQARRPSSQTPALASPRPPNVIAGPQPLHFDVVTPATIKNTETAASVQDGLRRRVEANSGATTVRRLGLKMDPNRAPRLNLFGWNIGARQLSSSLPATTPLLVTEITSLDHMKALAQVYFDKLDPCYGFIDKQQFFDRLNARWTSVPEPNVYDSVLAGVAALGCLFSQRNCTVTELHLVQSARSTLDSHIFSVSASLDLLTGWLLRTIHLRLTDSPYATWIASSTLMHLIEALGLQSDSDMDPVYASSFPPSAQCDPDLKRRIVGVSHHLNAWTSFDLGLSRVLFQKHDLPLPPAPKPGDYTTELIRLLPTSVSLDPSVAAEDGGLLPTLSNILNGSHTQLPSVMAQTNLVLCLVRRILSQNLDMSYLAEQVLGLLRKALGCARSLAQDCSPWHQVANVPFHIICVLLIMDTRSSLATLPEAIQTVGLVASIYDTETMREAKRTAYLLVLLHQQRRKDDLAVFGKALAENLPEPRMDLTPQNPTHFNTSEDHAWLEALVADLPSLRDADLDEFLNTDMIGGPLFLGA